MTQTSSRKSYSFKEGLAMMAAKGAGVDPYLAAEAGDGAKAALNHLRKAKQAKTAAARATHIKDAQVELKSISVTRHPKLVNAIQGQLLALQGRGGDTEIAHLTRGEVVLPRSLQTPALMKQIAALAAQQGLNPAQLRVGNSANKMNPRTGQREFDVDKDKYTSREGVDERHLESIDVIGRRDVYDWHNSDWMRPYDFSSGNFGVTEPEINFGPMRPYPSVPGYGIPAQPYVPPGLDPDLQNVTLAVPSSLRPVLVTKSKEELDSLKEGLLNLKLGDLSQAASGLGVQWIAMRLGLGFNAASALGQLSAAAYNSYIDGIVDVIDEIRAGQ